MGKALSPRQQRFVEAYLVALNATQAAITAGYSKKTADVQGPRLLGNVGVAAAIRKAQHARSIRTEITADRVLRELALIGFANMQDYMGVTTDGLPYVDLSKLTREQAAAIQEFTVDEYVEGRGEGAVAVRKVRFKLHSRCPALELLGKHLALFKERIEVETKGGLLVLPEQISAWSEIAADLQRRVAEVAASETVVH